MKIMMSWLIDEDKWLPLLKKWVSMSPQERANMGDGVKPSSPVAGGRMKILPYAGALVAAGFVGGEAAAAPGVVAGAEDFLAADHASPAGERFSR